MFMQLQRLGQTVMQTQIHTIQRHISEPALQKAGNTGIVVIQSCHDVQSGVSELRQHAHIGGRITSLKGATLNLERIYEENNIYTTFQKSSACVYAVRVCVRQCAGAHERALAGMFPGLIYRPPASAVVLLLFQSGKVVITGGKSTKDVVEGWKELWPFVRGYIEPAAA